jgi:hypothetical protein
MLTATVLYIQSHRHSCLHSDCQSDVKNNKRATTVKVTSKGNHIYLPSAARACVVIKQRHEQALAQVMFTYT